MAEFGSIPGRLNGLPIPELADVQIQMQRTTNQKATTDGIKLTYGRPKWQVTITHVTLANKLQFLRDTGAYLDNPPLSNFGFDLGSFSFSCINGIPSGLTASSNQDGDANLQTVMMFEKFKDEN